MTKKTKDGDNKEEEEEGQRLFKKRLAADVACGGIAKKRAIAPTEEKDIILEPPEGFIPYVNWPPIPPIQGKKLRQTYFKDSTITVGESSFMVVQNDRTSYSWHPYNGKDITREDAWEQTLEYLRKIYESVA